jgi:hypothetical protein
MVRNKVVAAMTGAALVVALFGGTASADDVPSNAPVERHNMSIICSFQGGTLWVDTDGDGRMDTSMSVPCFGHEGVWHITY